MAKTLPQPATLELEHFLPYRLSVLSNTISAAIAAEYARRFSLSVTEWRVLAVLGRYADLSAVEVAERTAMDKVAVSRAVGALLKSGRIRRGVHGDDKRRSVLTLSARGRRVYEEVAPMALRYERELLAVLSDEERMWLERILAKFVGEGHAALQRAAGAAPR
jgi:DNA-binding MarR family transcriptional regulator